MSNKIAKKKHVNQTFAAKINHVIRIIIRVALTVYVSLLIVVMPFYNTDGYARIGTNKFSFFKFWTVPAIYLLLPLCIIYGFFYLVDRITSSSNRQPNTKKNKNIFTILRLNLHKKPNAISHQESNGLLHEKNTVKPTVRQHAILDINAKDLKHGILCGLSLTDIGAIVFGVSVLLSYLLTANRQEALWGATGWYMGCITQLALVGLYFLISRFWKVSPWMIGLFLPVSALVFLFGLLNRFGIDPLSMDINNPVYISTIGNINWYCGYLVPIFFACATFIWQRKWGNPLVRILLWIYVGLGFATLVTHGSSSGIVALGVMLVVWYGLSGLPARENDGKQLVAFLKLALFLGGVCLAIWLLRRGLGAQMTYAEMSTDILTYTPLPFLLLTVAGFYWFVTHRYVKKGTYARSRFRFLPLFLLGGAGLCVLFVLGAVILNTVRSGSLGALSENQAFVFSPTWGSNRGMTWRAGVELFWQASPVHKIFGVGPDCFAVYLQENGGTELVELVGTVFAGSRLTNAHNEWLTILVNEGIVGLAGFGVMVVSAIWRFVKRGQREKTPTWRAGVLIACGMGILAHSVNGFFSFQQTMSVTSLYLLLGFGEAVYREKVK